MSSFDQIVDPTPSFAQIVDPADFEPSRHYDSPASSSSNSTVSIFTDEHKENYFDGGRPPIVTIDFRVPVTKNGIGIVPLKRSMREMAKDRGSHYSDSQAWLQRFSFAPNGGLPILRVDSKSPAYQYGLRSCDVIVAIEMKDVRNKTAAEVGAKIKKAKSEMITVSVVRCTCLPPDAEDIYLLAEQSSGSRASSSYEVKLTIEWDPEFRAGGFGFTPLKYAFADKATVPRSQKHLYTQMKERCPFARGHGGLPVQFVDQNGPASVAGLQPWDVITSVNGVNVCEMGAADVSKLVKDQRRLDLVVLRSVEPVAPKTQTLKPLQRAIASLHFLSKKDDDNMTFHRREEVEDCLVTADVDSLVKFQSPVKQAPPRW